MTISSQILPIAGRKLKPPRIFSYRNSASNMREAVRITDSGVRTVLAQVSSPGPNPPAPSWPGPVTKDNKYSFWWDQTNRQIKTYLNSSANAGGPEGAVLASSFEIGASNNFVRGYNLPTLGNDQALLYLYTDKSYQNYLACRAFNKTTGAVIGTLGTDRFMNNQLLYFATDLSGTKFIAQETYSDSSDTYFWLKYGTFDATNGLNFIGEVSGSGDANYIGYDAGFGLALTEDGTIAICVTTWDIRACNFGSGIPIASIPHGFSSWSVRDLIRLKDNRFLIIQNWSLQIVRWTGSSFVMEGSPFKAPGVGTSGNPQHVEATALENSNDVLLNLFYGVQLVDGYNYSITTSYYMKWNGVSYNFYPLASSGYAQLVSSYSLP